jgi:periplasmic protein TonB
MNPNVHTAEILPPRALLFLGVIALHVVFGYLLTTGLMRGIIKVLMPEPIISEIIPETPRPPPQRVIVEPNLTDPIPVPLPVPDIPVEQVNDPVFTSTIAEPAGPIAPPRDTPVIVAEPPIRLVGRNVLPNAEEYYPARERRDGVEGSTVVRACVTEAGKLDGTPMVEATSGSARLDEAAIRVARDGRYARSMRGDSPVANCHRFRVIFSMRN